MNDGYIIFLLVVIAMALCAGTAMIAKLLADDQENKLEAMKKIKTIMGDFTEKEFNRLRQRYQEAVFNKEDTFTLDGRDYVTDFAKHLLDFLLPHFQTPQ